MKHWGVWNTLSGQSGLIPTATPLGGVPCGFPLQNGDHRKGLLPPCKKRVEIWTQIWVASTPMVIISPLMCSAPNLLIPYWWSGTWMVVFFVIKKSYKGRRIMQNTIGSISSNEHMVKFCHKLRNKTSNKAVVTFPSPPPTSQPYFSSFLLSSSLP